MPEITCTALKCAYNQEGYCEKENVRIDVDDCSDYSGCTCCESFVDRDTEGDCRDCCINCKGSEASVECFASDCVYNDDMECCADCISVEGNHARCTTDTFCDTYRSKNRK